MVPVSYKGFSSQISTKSFQRKENCNIKGCGIFIELQHFIKTNCLKVRSTNSGPKLNSIMI